MGKHTMPPTHPRVRTAMVGAVLATAGISMALAGAGTAEAKTHHGVDAPGNPFGASQAAAGYQSPGSSFTTVRIARGGPGGATTVRGTTTGEAVSTAGGTTIRSSGGLISSRVGSTTQRTGESVSNTGGTSTTRGSHSAKTRTGTSSATTGTSQTGGGAAGTGGAVGGQAKSHH